MLMQNDKSTVKDGWLLDREGSSCFSLLVVYDDMKLAERRHGGGEGSDRRVSVEH
jgi:hypothetical protein